MLWLVVGLLAVWETGYKTGCIFPHNLYILTIRWLDVDCTVLVWNGLLPKHHLNVLVKCQMIFSPSRWAIRGLTLEEMMIAADIPEDLRPERLLPRRSPMLKDVPFHIAAPLRVMSQALALYTQNES